MPTYAMPASILPRLCLLASLGTLAGCDLFLRIPNLGDPQNVADMTTRFKTTIESQLHAPVPLDWGPSDRNIWRHYLGPQVVEFCGRPTNASPAQRAYQIDFSRGSYANIRQNDVNTPAHPKNPPLPDTCNFHPPAGYDPP